jgi:hypothetical protein
MSFCVQARSRSNVKGSLDNYVCIHNINVRLTLPVSRSGPFTHKVMRTSHCTSPLILCTHFWLSFIHATCPSHHAYSCGPTAPIGPRPPHFGGFYITLRHTPQSVGLLWTSDQSVAETSTWQHTNTYKRKSSMPRWDSNPRFQQALGQRPTPRPP